MIEIKDQPDGGSGSIIEARSNLSMTLDRLTVVFLGISAVTLVVAMGPVLVGLWPVLVVAVVHLVIVGVCFRSAWRGNWARELFSIGPEMVRLEHYESRRCESKEWPAAWVRVQTERRPLGDRRIYLSCQGERQQIGAFLPVSERVELAEILNQRLQPISAWRQ